MKIKELKTEQEIRKISPFVADIYKNFSEEFYVENILISVSKDYKIAAVFEENNKMDQLAGFIGIRLVNKLQHGRTIEVEDFGIRTQNQFAKTSKIMIGWAEEQAELLGCKSIICSLSTFELEAHKFFSMEKFVLEGFFFRKEV